MTPFLTRIDQYGWSLLSRIHILFLFFGVAALFSSIGWGLKGLEVSPNVSNASVAWVYLITRPAALFFYACACFLLREIVSISATRAGIVHANDVSSTTGSKSSAGMREFVKFSAYFFVCFGVFAFLIKFWAVNTANELSFIKLFYYGVRSATEQWFYAAVLFSLLLILDFVSVEEQS